MYAREEKRNKYRIKLSNILPIWTIGVSSYQETLGASVECLAQS